MWKSFIQVLSSGSDLMVPVFNSLNVTGAKSHIPAHHFRQHGHFVRRIMYLAVHPACLDNTTNLAIWKFYAAGLGNKAMFTDWQRRKGLFEHKFALETFVEWNRRLISSQKGVKLFAPACVIPDQQRLSRNSGQESRRTYAEAADCRPRHSNRHTFAAVLLGVSNLMLRWSWDWSCSQDVSDLVA